MEQRQRIAIIYETLNNACQSRRPVTGGQRTIKWDITSGSAQKGQFFYFGFQGRKINGSAGVYAFPPATNWYQKNYATTGNNLGDGGLVHPSVFSTSGPWANSGNAWVWLYLKELLLLKHPCRKMYCLSLQAEPLLFMTQPKRRWLATGFVTMIGTLCIQ